MSNPNLLCLSYSFPPDQGAQSIQISRLLAYSKQRLTVLTCKESDLSAVNHVVDADPKVSYLASKSIYLSPILRKRNIIRRIFSKIIDLSQILPDDAVIFWSLPVLIWSLKNLRPRNRYSHIVTFGNPMSLHIIGFLLSVLFKTKHVCHFSDPWHLNPYRKYNRYTFWINKQLEKLILCHSTTVLFTSKDTVDIYVKAFPFIGDKCFTIPHSCSLLMLTKPPSLDMTRVHKSIYSISIIGSFYKGRSILPILKLFGSYENNVRLKINIYGSMRQADQKSIKEFFHPHTSITYNGVVSFMENIHLIKNSDGLISIDGDMHPSPFFPSKLTDYFASCKPILLVSPAGSYSQALALEFNCYFIDIKDSSDSILLTPFIDAIIHVKQDNTNVMFDKVKSSFSPEVVSGAFDTSIQAS